MSGFTFDEYISRPVQILVGVVLVVMLVVGVCLPIVRQQDELAVEVRMAKGKYLEAVVLVKDYESLRQNKNSKKSVVLQEQLFSYVEKVTRSLKLNKRIDYIRPENRTRDDGSTIEVVHIAFKGISLDELVNFLYHIEVEKREIYIKAISIKKDGKKNLNTQMTLQKIG